MKNGIVVTLVMFMLAMFSSGCASIICGSEKTINIRSQPLEAKYTIANKKGEVIAQGVTPTNVTLKRGSGYFGAGDYKITLEKTGYKTSTQPIEQGLEAGWYVLGNLVFGGLIGWIIVDPITGGMWDIKDVNVALQPAGSAMLVPVGYAPNLRQTSPPSSAYYPSVFNQNQ